MLVNDASMVHWFTAHLQKKKKGTWEFIVTDSIGKNNKKGPVSAFISGNEYYTKHSYLFIKFAHFHYIDSIFPIVFNQLKRRREAIQKRKKVMEQWIRDLPPKSVLIMRGISGSG